MPSRTGLAIDIAVKAATVGLLAWAVANPDLPQFQGKAFIGRAIAYPIVLLVVPVAWWLLGRRRIPFPLLPDILIGLPFLIDVAGNALNLYDTVESWDDLNHLVNWGLHTAGIGLLLRYSAASPGVRAALAFECRSDARGGSCTRPHAPRQRRGRRPTDRARAVPGAKREAFADR